MTLPFLNRKAAPPATRRLVIGDEFGRPLTREEVNAALHGCRDQLWFRAFGQMLMALREESTVAADKATVSGQPHLAQYQMGAQNACMTLADMLLSLSRGQMGDDVKEWFVAAAEREAKE